jgi:hypothetical protein
MLKIVNVRDATSEEWDDMWRSCQSATYYHSREWAEIWQSYTNGAIIPVPVTLTFSDDIQVVLPVMKRKYYKGLITRYALTGPPFISKYGNWLSKDKLHLSHISLISQFIVEKYKNLTWQLNPFDSNSKNVHVKAKYCRRFPETDYAINLTKGEAAIYSSFKNSCRNHIKQGLNNKLVVAEGSGIELWRKYFGIYQDTVKRWGEKTPYVLDWKLFEILLYKNSPYIKLWLVWYGDVAIAGCINFYSNRKIMAWHMTSLTEYRNLRPVHLLEYSMILDGIQKQFDWYDMGTDAGSKGLQDFKRSFGPDKLMSDKIVAWQPAFYYLTRAKNQMDTLKMRHKKT